MSLAVSGSEVLKTEMAFTKVVFQLKKINSLPLKCDFLPSLPLFATNQSARTIQTANGHKFNSKPVLSLKRSSNRVFEFKVRFHSLHNLVVYNKYCQ